MDHGLKCFHIQITTNITIVSEGKMMYVVSMSFGLQVLDPIIFREEINCHQGKWKRVIQCCVINLHVSRSQTERKLGE